MEVPANKLPVELWARIIKKLSPCSMTGRPPQLCWIPSMFARQSSFWQLPSVCKAFQATFQSHPEFCSHISISDQMLERGESSLLAWLRTHRTVLKSLQAHTQHPQVAQYLLALSDAECALECASLTASKSVLNSLETFTALTTCSLRGDSPDLGSPNLDLMPLQTLETLTSLALETGRFTNVNAAGHLTSLAARHVRITSSEDCRFCSSLLDLQIAGACISMHTRGLCACTALQSMNVGLYSSILAQDRSLTFHPHVAMNHQEVLCPTVVSCLTALTRLGLSFCAQQQAAVLGISMLASLEHLTLSTSSSFRVGQEFEALTKLTWLCICGTSTGLNAAEAYVDLSLNWEPLQALQVLWVLSRFSCDERLLTLAALQNLRDAHFSEAQPVNSSVTALLATLQHRFAKKNSSSLLV